MRRIRRRKIIVSVRIHTPWVLCFSMVFKINHYVILDNDALGKEKQLHRRKCVYSGHYALA